MIDEIQKELHRELLDLQLNLKDLQSARTQIETVKETASKVIAGIDDLRQRYETHLPELLQNLTAHNEKQTQQLIAGTQQSVEQAMQHLWELSDELSTQNKHQHEKIAAYLSTYENALQTIRSLEGEIAKVDFPERLSGINQTVIQIHESVDEAIAVLKEVRDSHAQYLHASRSEHRELLQQLTQSGEQQLNGLVSRTGEAVARVAHTVETLSESVGQGVQQQREEITHHLLQTQQQFGETIAAVTRRVEAGTDRLSTAIDTMSAAFQKQESEITYYLRAYQGLVNYVKAVEAKVEELDFPVRIGQMQQRVEQITQGIEQSNRQGEEARKLLREETEAKHNALEQSLAAMIRRELREQLQQSNAQLENTELRIRNNAESLSDRLQRKLAENLATTNTDLQSKIDKQAKQMQVVTIFSIITFVSAILAIVFSLVK